MNEAMKILSKRLLLLCAVFFVSVVYAAPSADDLLQSCEDSYLQQDYADALAYGKQALPLCEGTDMEADCLNLLAMICFRQSDFEQAIDYAQRCYRLHAQTGDVNITADNSSMGTTEITLSMGYNYTFSLLQIKKKSQK